MLSRCLIWWVSWFVSLSAVAQSSAEESRTGFWGGLDIGVASVNRSYSMTASTSQTTFALTLSGGYAWDPRLLLGIELGGWTLQASDWWWNPDSSQGEAIETVFAIARYYPTADSKLFVKGGGGLVHYWTNRPGESGANGWGGMIGVGYDVYVRGSIRVAPFVSYSFGSFSDAISPPGIKQDEHYQAATVYLGVTFR
jgi:hypothetical protein